MKLQYFIFHKNIIIKQKIFRKVLRNLYLFDLINLKNYPTSIPFSTVSSGVTNDNFPSGFVVKSNIP